MVTILGFGDSGSWKKVWLIKSDQPEVFFLAVAVGVGLESWASEVWDLLPGKGPNYSRKGFEAWGAIYDNALKSSALKDIERYYVIATIVAVVLILQFKSSWKGNFYRYWWSVLDIHELNWLLQKSCRKVTPCGRCTVPIMASIFSASQPDLSRLSQQSCCRMISKIPHRAQAKGEIKLDLNCTKNFLVSDNDESDQKKAGRQSCSNTLTL